MMRTGRIVFLVSLLVAAASLGCSKKPGDPLAALIRQYDKYPEYSIVLHDMDQEGSIFKKYNHLYKVVYGSKKPGSEVVEFDTKIEGWFPVPKELYKSSQSMLGMVLVSKGEDGQVSRHNFPPGYQYVGNSQYGQWQRDSSGRNFWVFYGQYSMFRNLLGMGNRPLYRDDYDRYADSRRSRRPYYGPSGNSFGTRGSVTRQNNPTFFERQQARQSSRRSSFSDRASSRTGSRSRGASRGGK